MYTRYRTPKLNDTVETILFSFYDHSFKKIHGYKKDKLPITSKRMADQHPFYTILHSTNASYDRTYALDQSTFQKAYQVNTNTSHISKK